MIIRKILLCGLILGLLVSCRHTEKYEAFYPGESWLDNNGIHINAHGGSILYDESDNKYYWFGEHKTEGGVGNLALVGVRCYSSKDLYNWIDEGIALAVDTLDSGSEIEEGCLLERPRVIYNSDTKKYVMWFHLEPKIKSLGDARSGVAVSDKITGPYAFIHSVRPNAGHWPLNVQDIHKNNAVAFLDIKYDGRSLPADPDTLNLLGRDMAGGQMARDMALFVDDDGKAYHIYSSEDNSTLHIALLDDNYTNHTGIYKRYFVGRFMGAPTMFKKDNKYYLMMSGFTGWEPNEARSAVADSIFGDWVELGNPCSGDDAELTFYSQSSYILPVHGKFHKSANSHSSFHSITNRPPSKRIGNHM